MRQTALSLWRGPLSLRHARVACGKAVPAAAGSEQLRSSQSRMSTTEPHSRMRAQGEHSSPLCVRATSRARGSGRRPAGVQPQAEQVRPAAGGTGPALAQRAGLPAGRLAARQARACSASRFRNEDSSTKATSSARISVSRQRCRIASAAAPASLRRPGAPRGPHHRAACGRLPRVSTHTIGSTSDSRWSQGGRAEGQTNAGDHARSGPRT